MSLTIGRVSEQFLSAKYILTYQFLNLIVRNSRDTVSSSISQKQLAWLHAFFLWCVASVDISSPLLAEEVIARTFVVAVVTVTHEFPSFASELVDEGSAAVAGICIRDDIPVARNVGKLNRSPSLSSLPTAAIVGIGARASETVAVPAVLLPEPLDVDSRGRGGKGKNDRVTHLMIG